MKFKNPNPECEREDCKFEINGGASTLAYYPPVYDKNGNLDKHKILELLLDCQEDISELKCTCLRTESYYD